jgi:RNA polymerase sigma-70 factor, ECF subfamily
MTQPTARGGSNPAVPDGSWDWPLARARCFRLALRLLRHPEDAEEAVQEAMIRAWRARDDCRVPAARTAWLLQITRREAFRVAERRSRVRDREQPDSQEDELVSLRHCELDGVESRVSFDQALGLLQPHDRDLVRLRYAEDLTQEQVAARLDLPEGTVKVRLHRARERLRKALEEFV